MRQTRLRSSSSIELRSGILYQYCAYKWPSRPTQGLIKKSGELLALFPPRRSCRCTTTTGVVAGAKKCFNSQICRYGARDGPLSACIARRCDLFIAVSYLIKQNDKSPPESACCSARTRQDKNFINFLLSTWRTFHLFSQRNNALIDAIYRAEPNQNCIRANMHASFSNSGLANKRFLSMATKLHANTNNVIISANLHKSPA